jgi:voltage-gated potassium channel
MTVPATARGAERRSLDGTTADVLICGASFAGLALIHFTDRKNFPDIGDSLWWAIQTVTTVGYGDLVPTSATGRFVAAVVMLIGIGFLTVITAAITSTFIETARRRIEGNATDALSGKLDQIGARLDVIEAGLENIRHGRDDQS